MKMLILLFQCFPQTAFSRLQLPHSPSRHSFAQRRCACGEEAAPEPGTGSHWWREARRTSRPSRKMTAGTRQCSRVRCELQHLQSVQSTASGTCTNTYLFTLFHRRKALYSHSSPPFSSNSLPSDGPHTANISTLPPSDEHSPIQRRFNYRPPISAWFAEQQVSAERREGRSTTKRLRLSRSQSHILHLVGRWSSATSSPRLGPTICTVEQRASAQAEQRPAQSLGMAPTQDFLIATDLHHPRSRRGACSPGLITKEAAAVSWATVCGL